MINEEDLYSIGFHQCVYSIGIEFNKNYDCDSFGCREDGECRCGSIDENSIKLSIPPLSPIAKCIEIFVHPSTKTMRRFIKYELSDSELRKIEAVLNDYRLYDSNEWFVSIHRGEYGDEIQSVYPKQYNSIINDIKFIITNHENKSKDCETRNETTKI